MRQTLAQLSSVVVPIILGFAGLSNSCIGQETRSLFDFSNTSQRGSWVNVNDGVMGGVSRGVHQMTADGLLRFSGNLSLANNGGFASVRSRGTSLGLQANDELLLRVKGDGRVYNLDLRVPSNRMAFTYRVTLQTKANQWLEFRVPMNMFTATSFGRVVRNGRPLNAGMVNSVGFTISDKKPGPFQLDVQWIKSVKPRATVISSVQ